MPAARRRSGIRWDRLGRVALLEHAGRDRASPTSPRPGSGFSSPGTAERQKQELSQLTTQKKRLKRRLRALRDPGALEREARRLGMVRVGERSYVIENLP